MPQSKAPQSKSAQSKSAPVKNAHFIQSLASRFKAPPIRSVPFTSALYTHLISPFKLGISSGGFCISAGTKSKVSSDKETRGGTCSRLNQKKGDSDSNPLNRPSLDGSSGRTDLPCDADMKGKPNHLTQRHGYVIILCYTLK